MRALGRRRFRFGVFHPWSRSAGRGNVLHEITSHSSRCGFPRSNPGSRLSGVSTPSPGSCARADEALKPSPNNRSGDLEESAAAFLFRSSRREEAPIFQPQKGAKRHKNQKLRSSGRESAPFSLPSQGALAQKKSEPPHVGCYTIRSFRVSSCLIVATIFSQLSGTPACRVPTAVHMGNVEHSTPNSG